jgi:hypothetical protein
MIVLLFSYTQHFFPLSPFRFYFASYHLCPFILTSIAFSFLCDSYFYSFSPSFLFFVLHSPFIPALANIKS